MTSLQLPSPVRVFPPLSVRIGGPGSRPFKSIQSLVWNDIPPFAVLTGANGAGQTQLLELLAAKITGTSHHTREDVSGVTVHFDGLALAADDVAFIPNTWIPTEPPSMGI